MHTEIHFIIDVAAVLLLALGVYLPRHRRPDLAVAFICVNIGVLAVVGTLFSSAAGAGVGLGLFGVLSIIRLRSTEIGQREVAYYFSALALGVVGAMPQADLWRPAALSAAVVATVWAVDHPRLLGRERHEIVVLDGAVTCPADLHRQMQHLFGVPVHEARVERLDLVDDTTTVRVRLGAPPAGAPAGARTGVPAPTPGPAQVDVRTGLPADGRRP